MSIGALIAISAIGCQPSVGEGTASKSVAEIGLGARKDSAAIGAIPLEELIDRTLDFNRDRRLLSVDRNAAWQVAHGAVAYGNDLKLLVDGKTVLALEYLLSGGEMRGWQLSLGPRNPKTQRGTIQAYVEAGSYVGQGHVDQFVGYLSQAGLPLETKVMVDGQQLTLADWGRSVQYQVPNNPFREYSWTLIALTNLFPEELTWQGADGKTWSLEALVDFEAKQDLGESACGGMHRLMGLAHAVRHGKRLGVPLQGGWMAAKRVVDNAVDTIQRYQNADGTFSVNYTTRPGTSVDLSTRIGTTGHTLEVLAYALEPEGLREPWVERSVRRLCELLQIAEDVELECGGLYHGLSGLKLYREKCLASAP